MFVQGKTPYFKDSCGCGCKECDISDQHMCGDGHCIPPTQVCDGIDQCDNDEKNCGKCDDENIIPAHLSDTLTQFMALLNTEALVTDMRDTRILRPLAYLRFITTL